MSNLEDSLEDIIIMLKSIRKNIHSLKINEEFRTENYETAKLIDDDLNNLIEGLEETFVNKGIIFNE
jgi:hypothetical protein